MLSDLAIFPVETHCYLAYLSLENKTKSLEVAQHSRFFLLSRVAYLQNVGSARYTSLF